jgi:hypothetical protein
LQRWFSLTNPGASPYRLYSLSNLGSLLALVSYPVLLEPSLALRMQAIAWSGGFVAFGLLCGYCALRTWNVDARRDAPALGYEVALRPGLADWTFWLLLPACGSVMLLAVTNQMCQDVAVVPFLWVLPLALYLISFVICFDNERWYFRPVFWPALALSVAGMVWLMFGGVDVSIQKQVIGYSVGLFVCCMVCHGELVRLKPIPRYLTSFYLMTSAGGAIGGLFVTLVAPRIFRAYVELHCGVWATCAVASAAFWYDNRPHLRWRRSWWAQALLPIFAFGLVGLGLALWEEASRTLKGPLSISRNFYGVLRVTEYYKDDPDLHDYTLRHGRISHGQQFQSEERRRLPCSYYGPWSGVGLALLFHPDEQAQCVGVIGLGTGTIAAYGRRGDRYRFYEINPAVKRLATSTFTYLADSDAKCEIVMGDARLSLEREEPQRFDVLAVDAFSSDAIPVHLLTREAFGIYLRHMKPDGVIAVHISNRYLDLWPVVRGIACYFDLQTAMIESHSDEANGIGSASWVLLTRNEEFLQDPDVLLSTTDESEAELRPCLWTDDYSNLFQILK